MNKEGSDVPINVILAVEDALYSESAASLLTHISWPAATVVRVLASVPGSLPKMDVTPAEFTEADEEVEIMRWRDWATAKVLVTSIAAILHPNQLTVQTIISEGPLLAAVQKQINTTPATLVVIGAKNLQLLGEFDMGPGAAPQTTQADNYAMLIARPTEQVRPLNTILAVDDSPEAWRAVEFLCELSPPQWAKITLINMVQASKRMPAGMIMAGAGGFAPPLPSKGEVFMARVMERLHQCGAQVWRTLEVGHPVDTILTAIIEQRADLVVIGTHNQPELNRVETVNIIQEVVKYAPCSVLTVR